jgi:uncharacterized protein (DUF362 family)
MRRLDRRDFLAGSIAAAAALRSPGLRAEEAFDVVEVSGKDRKAMVKAALDALGGIGAFVKKGDRVVLKPNLAFAKPLEFATATHPDTLIAVAQACLEAGAKDVLVAEYPLNDPAKILERSGAGAALKAMPEVRLRMLEDHDEFREVEIPKGRTLKSTEVAKVILDADVFINLPQAKHHSSTGVSLGLKNAMGAIWSRKPFHVLYDIHKAIADLGLAVRPHLTLVDAAKVLLTNGPQGPGEWAEPGKMIAGRRIASVDAVALSVADFGGKKPQLSDARHIQYASEHGLGECELARIKVKRVAT